MEKVIKKWNQTHFFAIGLNIKLGSMGAWLVLSENNDQVSNKTSITGTAMGGFPGTPDGCIRGRSQTNEQRLLTLDETAESAELNLGKHRLSAPQMAGSYVSTDYQV
jgi:hypothetical protein